MAKKHKKRKKLSRRARQEMAKQHAAPQPRAQTLDDPEAAQEIPVVTKPATVDQPAKATRQETAPESTTTKPAKSEQSSPTSKVAFQTEQTKAPSGIDEELAAREYPAVRRDLKKLSLTIAVFVLIIAGLGVLGSTTNVIGNLGDHLFRLWQ